MIKDKYIADDILQSFPGITAADKKKIQDALPGYIFFKNLNKDTKQCTCSCCEKVFNITRKSRKLKFDDVKHMPHGHYPDKTCPHCGARVLFKKESYGRKVLEGWDRVCILRAKENNLYIRCFYVDYDYLDKIPKFTLNERHRYYAGEEGANHWEKRSIYRHEKWSTEFVRMKSENEPIFGSVFGGDYDINEYLMINRDEISKTCIRYCQHETYFEKFGLERPITFFCMAAKHPNMEYIIKTGFDELIRYMINGRTGFRINWKSNDVKEMLQLNRAEMKMNALKDPNTYMQYKRVRTMVPNKTPEAILNIVYRYGNYLDDAIEIHRNTGISFEHILRYAEHQNINYGFFGLWRDYIKECRYLQYDLRDTAITMPKDISKAHTRTSKIVSDLKEIERKKDKKQKAAEMEIKMKARYEKLMAQGILFEYGGLKIVIPKEYQEIVAEGRALGHCVGGYAARHADGALNILFIRRITDPETPYYTIEVSKEKKIIQCRGHHNCHNDADVLEFEKEFALHLAGKAAKKKTKQKAAVQAA